MPAVLFVCTGNIFRSMIAEYALKKELGPNSPYAANSAGTHAEPQAIVPLVAECLAQRGIDPSPHRQRRIDPELFVAPPSASPGWKTRRRAR
jgi:protein-tyrosine phosphatase